MSAVPLISKAEVKKRLEALGCEFALQFDSEHSIWRTPWGHHFFIPELPPDGMCSEWKFNEIVEVEIKGTQPVKH